ncbi:DNA-3-methyladenine glycosylase [bacterium]|nr:DNA-3-methyladenine glycosylase [bacterium]
METPKEFRFSECLRFLDRSKQERLHHIYDGKVTKLCQFDETLIAFELQSPSDRSIDVRFLNGSSSQTIRSQVSAYIRNWFDLETDLEPFYELAASDILLKNLVKKHFGLRLLRISSLFQALCWAIIGQQVNLNFAYTLYRRFIESFGQNAEIGGRTYWLFPVPSRVATLEVSDLRSLQFTGMKSEYIIGIAQLIAEDKLSKKGLMALGEFDKALHALVKIRGIGEWTANYVLMRCLGFRSAFPIQDIGLHRAIQLQLEMPRKPSIEEIRRLSTGWADWEAYATFYLYRSLL